jgi:hypothetical protein
MMDQRRSVKAATFRLWYHIAPGNRWSAVILLHDLIGVGLRNGAIRPIVIHSSGPGSYAHLMFRYTPDPEFDWSGEIQLELDHGDPAVESDLLIAEVEAATGFAEHEDNE